MEALIVVCILIFAGMFYYLFFSSRSQILGRFPYHLKTKEKIIALTFDDGPNPPFTEKILNILNKYNVKATFFVVGKNMEKYPDLSRAIIYAGHTLGDHGYSHIFSKYFTDFSFKSEISRAQIAIKRITGKTPALFRPPWLFRHPWLLSMLKQNNLMPVSGVFGSELEIFQPPAEILVKKAVSKIKPGIILIFHDGYNTKGSNRSQTAEAINLLIPKLFDLGYKFVTVDHLLNVPAYQ